MLINYADITLGASIPTRSLDHPPPHHFEAALTPIFSHEDPRWHYAAALRPLTTGETEDWFEIDLGRERTIKALEIEWFSEKEVGTEFSLEYKLLENWLEIFSETYGDKIAHKDLYRRTFSSPVTARYFKFRLRKALGQNRLLIRQFRLLGDGTPPPVVLMIAPDNSVIDRRILQEARSLIDAEYQVVLACGFECPREEHYFQDGIAIHRYKYDWSMPWDRFVMDRLRQFPADVVHVHDLLLLPQGARIAAEWDVPLVFDAHEIYYETPSLSVQQRLLLARQERQYLPRVNLFITVNELIADYYKKLYGIRPLVIMNAIDSPQNLDIPKAAAKLRELAQLPTNSRIVLYQGWISADRNLETLVEAARYFPQDVYLVLIGYGEYEKELKALVENQPWRQKIRFLGPVKSDNLLGLTAGADLGVVPYQPIGLNHELCSPNKFFEYIQAGVPVVAQPLPFFQRMAEAYEIVTVADLSTAEGMAHAIVSLLEDQNQLNHMQQACQKAAKELNWETESRKLVAAYQRLLQEYQTNRATVLEVPYQRMALKQLKNEMEQIIQNQEALHQELQQQKQNWEIWQQQEYARWVRQEQRLQAMESMWGMRVMRRLDKIAATLRRYLGWHSKDGH